MWCHKIRYNQPFLLNRGRRQEECDGRYNISVAYISQFLIIKSSELVLQDKNVIAYLCKPYNTNETWCEVRILSLKIIQLVTRLVDYKNDPLPCIKHLCMKGY